MEAIRRLLSYKKIKILFVCAFAGLVLINYFGNLNYNSAFTDEAIYIIIGKIGLFYNDWYTFNSQNWVGGIVYFYTILTALGYQFAGLAGSRAINAALAVLLIGVVGLWVWKRVKSLWLAIMVSAFVGFNGLFIYTAKLATYDMPSLFFLVVSFFLLDYAVHSEDQIAKRKNYWISAITILISIAFKFTSGIYLPLWVFWGFVNKKQDFNSWLWYGFIWMAVGIGVLGILLWHNLTQFAQLQATREQFSKAVVIGEIINYSFQIHALFLLGLVGWLFRGKWKEIVFFGGLVFAPIMLHVMSGRLATLDKHMIWSITFAILAFGLGIGQYVKYFKPVVKSIWIIALGIYLAIYYVYQSDVAKERSSSWYNTISSNQYLKLQVDPKDSLLTEVGPPAMLEVFEVISPVNVTTFDWIDYRGKSDLEGYEQAVRDGQFNWIQLLSDDIGKSDHFAQVNRTVVANLDDNYELVNNSNGILVYRRKF